VGNITFIELSYPNGYRNKAGVRTNKTSGKKNDAGCILRTAVRKGIKKEKMYVHGNNPILRLQIGRANDSLHLTIPKLLEKILVSFPIKNPQVHSFIDEL